MTEKRRRKIGMIIKEGSKVYDLQGEKWNVLKEDITIDEWADHVGHIRFGYKEVRYSFVTSRNKKQFEILYSS